MSRSSSRFWNVSVAACVVASAPAVAGAQALVPDSGVIWQPTATMAVARYHHSATRLCSGKILVIGNVGQEQTAAVYDPDSDTWTDAPGMRCSHGFHTATLIPKGCGGVDACEVLVAGGNFSPPSACTETYREAADGGRGSWHAAGNMVFPRSSHAAAPVSDGCNVMVTGGRLVAGDPLKATEIWDAATRRWTRAADMKHERLWHVAGALPGGSVVVAGGQGEPLAHATAETWNPVTNVWTETPRPARARWFHSGCSLHDGRFLVAGGQAVGTPWRSAEIYDPFRGTWESAGDMSDERTKFACTTLPDGRAFVTGGLDPTGTPRVLATTDIYDPAANTWTPGPVMNEGRYAHTSTALAKECGDDCPLCDVVTIGGYDTMVPKKTTETTKPQP